tara:strand:- start:35 stop:145 length:111 start_codon:yes stop_codon:yes gene_type:complete
MKKTWKQFNKLMKKGRIHKAVKAAGFRRKKNEVGNN